MLRIRDQAARTLIKDATMHRVARHEPSARRDLNRGRTRPYWSSPANTRRRRFISLRYSILSAIRVSLLWVAWSNCCRKRHPKTFAAYPRHSGSVARCAICLVDKLCPLAATDPSSDGEAARSGLTAEATRQYGWRTERRSLGAYGQLRSEAVMGNARWVRSRAPASGAAERRVRLPRTGKHLLGAVGMTVCDSRQNEDRVAPRGSARPV